MPSARFHRRTLVPAALATLLIAVVLFPAVRDMRPGDTTAPRPAGRRGAPGPHPSDWFEMQRMGADGRVPHERWLAAVEQARVQRAAGGYRLEAAAGTLTWQPAGPYNIGGRVTALAFEDGGVTGFLGAANGGVFKTTNSGTNWTPVFDEFAAYSIGAVVMDPTDPDVVYVGTGEGNAAVNTYDGAGVYKTTDGGATWGGIGLVETRRIGAMAIDPQNPQRVFVAAMGTQFSTGPHRGLYRSEDGGANWTQVLAINDSTGVVDVVINPAHPETVYCASWERIRRYTYRRAFGPGSGIWRSTDHGTTWTLLQAGLPPPSDDVGRIGLAIAPSRPSTVYAQYITGSALGYNGLGFYRTTDGGDTWARRDTGSGFTGAFGGFGWYFGEVGVDPVNPEIVFAMGVTLQRSTDGGINWTNRTGTAHVDQHAMWIDPSNPSRVLLGNDGGFYSSLNGSSTWTKSLDLPITQFYAGTIDPSFPARLFGGTQDNGPMKTPTGATNDWIMLISADGFYTVVDHSNNLIVFTEYQFGSYGLGPLRSTNGGNVGSFSSPVGFVSTDRYNWSMPFVMSPLNRNVLLAGSHRVYRSTDNGLNYAPVSADLTKNNTGSLLTYSTISTLDISPKTPNLFYAGTDDGRVWRSSNGGAAWNEITAGLPDRWVTRVTASPNDTMVVYVTHSGFGMDESIARVHRSTDRGATWSDIGADLPDVPANDILEDPADPNRLYLATDLGVYTTGNLGATWYPLGQGLPPQAVFDIELHKLTRKLAAFTHGRSIWTLDLNDLPVGVAPPAADDARLSLAAPAPNPFRDAARFALDLPGPATVEVAVFDASGRRVRSIAAGALPAGRHAMRWDGHDDRGRDAGAGVYYVRASAGEYGARMKRLVKLR